MRPWPRIVFSIMKSNLPKVLSPHRDATRKRMEGHKVVLCVQDTTEMDFTGRKLRGAGPLSVSERIGFFNHVTLAVTPERLCLGVLDAEMWARDFEDPNKNDKRKQKPIEEKESFRWLEGYRRVCDLSKQLPDTQLISISDREGDIYECFWKPCVWMEVSELNLSFVVARTETCR